MRPRPAAARRRALRAFPWLLLGHAVLLAALGLVFLRSAAAGDPGLPARQRTALLAGALLLPPLGLLRRRAWLRAAWPAYGATLALLCLLPLFGVTLNGARRWFRLGTLTFQPAELVKPALILVLAAHLRLKARRGFRETVLVPLGLTLVPAFLIARQPDLGSALSLFPLLFALSFAAGARGRSLLLLAGSGLALLALGWPLLHDYQRERILVWLHQGSMDPVERMGAGYHLYQSLVAVGSAGWTGAGLGQGPQNVLDYLPYRTTDFLFSVVAEELGFAGATALVVLYAGLGFQCFRRAVRSVDPFARLLLVGAGAFFLDHLFIHAGVCLGLLPPTGLPLPFLSYGRTSVAGAFLVLALAVHGCTRQVRTVAPDRRA